ncbi:SCO2521 family protein [Actinocorallia sp. A-T 12471]|uniref:SCO2521 family protein n=1 Tax=Actinocorallia sp. A-T 12471 TaxID=3089813 RepID=UPI0029D27D2C|nr:SCO2521 family protein [Actinocorallia sp. A-T 12471]MDX6739818.1 SCO2521 family protein [Actinocorallia sp. A-T 12471]
MSSPTRPDDVLVLGEVKTGLLRHAHSVPEQQGVRLLDLVHGETVRYSDYPRPVVISAERLTGLDCPLPTASGRRSRAVGTAASGAILNGGRMLQAYARATLVRGAHGHRQEWSHYLARPGVVESVGKVDFADVAAGFAGSVAGRQGVDLGAVAARTMATVQAASVLDGRPPIRAAVVSWRWALVRADPDRPVRLTFLDDRTRLLLLSLGDCDAADAMNLVLDFALHDWLLSTVEDIVARADLESEAGERALRRVRPVLVHLLHHWMPAARLRGDLLPLFSALDRARGLSRRWDNAVRRIRDQFRLAEIQSVASAISESRALRSAVDDLRARSSSPGGPAETAR